MSGLDDEPTTEGYPNIKLEYRLTICYAVGEDEVNLVCKNGAEFFLDEHELQWVKFTPDNGYNHGREHMVRTDCVGFCVVRGD